MILAKNMDVLFRSVPPSLMLALSMTEKHEKSERSQFMQEHDVTEVVAAQMVADQIDIARGIG